LVGVVEVVRVALVLVVGKLYMWSQESYFHSDGSLRWSSSHDTTAEETKKDKIIAYTPRYRSSPRVCVKPLQSEQRN
jgi:hypothetical protein